MLIRYSTSGSTLFQDVGARIVDKRVDPCRCNAKGYPWSPHDVISSSPPLQSERIEWGVLSHLLLIQQMRDQLCCNHTWSCIEGCRLQCQKQTLILLHEKWLFSGCNQIDFSDVLLFQRQQNWLGSLYMYTHALGAFWVRGKANQRCIRQ